MEEVIKAQELGGETISHNFFRKLEFLELKCLLKLTRFCTGNFIECPSLKILKIESCDELETFIADSVSSNVTLANHDAGQTNSALFDQKVAFPELEALHVMDMHKLKHVWKWNTEVPTAIVSFVRLKKLQINDCSALEEIVLKEETTQTIPKFVFPQLGTLHLRRLERLKSFYSESHTLRCSKLQNLTICECKRLKIFNSQAEEDMQNSTNMTLLSSIENTFPKDLKLSSCIPKTLTTLAIDGCENLSYLFTPSMIENLAQLRKLEICDCKSMKIVIATEETTAKILFPKLQFLKIKGCHRVNTFISNFTSADEVGQTNSILFDQKIACPNLREMQIFKMSNLKMIWDNQLHSGSFCNLEKLIVEDGKSLLKIFSVSMLGRLQNLKTLSVKNCDLVEEVFDLQKLVVANLEDANNVATSQLMILNIDNLPNLKHIWNMDPLETSSVLNLCEIYVQNCSSLKWAFPASIAKEGLQKLERLDIGYCCGMENIVAKKEGTEATPKFVFSDLKFLKLWELENLRSFYPGIHILEVPILESFRVFGCVNLETFAAKSEKMQKMQIEDERQFEIQVQSLFSFKKVIPNLRVLTLRSKDIPMIQLQGPFHTVEELELQYFHDKKLSSSPFDILPMFPNVKTLVLNSCDFEELFSGELVIEEKHATSLAQIRGLRLANFPYLTSICSQKPQVEQVLQNIEELDVHRCHSLINLVPSSMSFFNLTTLEVPKCDGLVKLVTSKTAKSMVHLGKMVVKDCKMLIEIIANEEDEAQNEITFNKLKSLTLDCLTSLTIFSSETCIIKCPSLQEVIVVRCSKMKIFSKGVVSAPELQKVYLTEEKDKWRWKKDLNTTLQLLHTEMNSQEE